MCEAASSSLSAAAGRRRKLLIWYWGRRGGGAQYCYEMARALQRQGEFDLCLSLSRQSDLYHRFLELGISSLDIDTYTDIGSAMRSVMRLPRLRRAFARFLDEQGVDAVLCTMAHLWNPLFLDLIRSRNLPYVVTVHDAKLHPGEQFKPYQRWLDHEIGRSDGVVTLSRHVRTVLCARHVLREDAVITAPLGPLLNERLHPLPLDGRPPRRLVFFGRILEYKGVDLLLDAFAALLRDFPDITLSIHGSGNAAPYTDRIAALPNITLDNRYIPENEIPAIMGKADLVVLPYREASQSGVIAMAQSCGVPVVVTPVGGLVEQVIDGETGLVTSEVTADCLAASIRRMIKDGALYERCARGGVRHSASVWTEAAAEVSRLITRLSAERQRV